MCCIYLPSHFSQGNPPFLYDERIYLRESLLRALKLNGFSDRKKLLGVTLGGGLLIHLSLGVIIGVSVPYLLLSLLYTAIGFIAIQHYIKHVNKETVCS